MVKYFFIILLSFCWHGAVLAGVPLIVRDDTGKELLLQKPAQRVLALYPSFSRIVATLGGADLLVGRTVQDEHAALELPQIGTHMRPNVELIALLRPDVVVQMSGRQSAADIVQRLESLGIPVLQFRLSTFDDIFFCVRQLGVLIGSEPAAVQLLGQLKQQLAVFAKKRAAIYPKPRVFFEVRYPNLLGAGKGSIVNEIIEYAGGENVLATYSQSLVRLNEEILLALDPDTYIVQQGPMNKAFIPLEQREYFRDLSAVKKKSFLLVDELIFSRPGLDSLSALAFLSDFLHANRRLINQELELFENE